MLLEVIWSVVVGAGIVGLLVAVSAPFIEDWIRDGVAKQGLDGFWAPILRWALVLFAGAAVVAMLGLLAVSVFRRSWRARIWLPLGWLVRDTWPVRSITHRQAVAAADTVGYARRSSEVDAERASAPQPAWRIAYGDSHFGAANIHWLYNWGHDVRDVSLTCDREYFELDGEAFFGGSWGSGVGGATGKQFRGMPTAKGFAEGVDFTATWFDANGDEQHTVVCVPPEEIRRGRDAVAEKARADGYKNGFEKGRNSAVPPRTGEQIHPESLAADPSRADGSPKAKAKASPPMTKARRLEILEHKAQQIETERQVLQQMYGRATDTPTINKFLDAKAALDDREKTLKGERRVAELIDEMGDKAIRRKT